MRIYVHRHISWRMLIYPHDAQELVFARYLVKLYTA